MLQRGLIETQHLTWALKKTIIEGKDSGSPTRLPKLGSGEDVVVFIILTFALGAFNWGVRLFVVKPCVRRLLWKKNNQFEKNISLRKEQKVDKFSQTAMELLFYGLFSYMNIIVFFSQRWSWPSERWWIDYEKVDTASEYSVHSYMTETVAAYFLLYGARYTQSVLSVFIEHRRKDFIEMQIHHFVVVNLIVLAYYFGWIRIGLAIMVVQDPADVPLHIAKMLKYLGDARCPENPKNFYQVLSDVTFVIFMATFFTTRLGLYPYVIWSAHYETPNIPRELPGYSCLSLLYLLLSLQVFWAWLIIRVLYKLVHRGHVEDDRSDCEDDDASDDLRRSSKKEKIEESVKVD